MIRRGFIAWMVITALGVSLVGWVSCYSFQCSVVRLTSRHWLAAHAGDGLVRLFWVSARSDRWEVVPSRNRRALSVLERISGTEDSDGLRRTPYGISQGRRGQVSDFGFLWRVTMIPGSGSTSQMQAGMVRTPVWAVVSLLLLYPTLSFLRGPVRRRRRRLRNQCQTCGYRLDALTDPRCPECGGAIPVSASAD